LKKNRYPTNEKVNILQEVNNFYHEIFFQKELWGKRKKKARFCDKNGIAEEKKTQIL